MSIQTSEQAELERLRAEVAALRKDAERLNWLEQHPDKPMRFHKKHWSCVGFTSYEYEVHRTARAAIDAAMREQAMQELVDQAQELGMGYGASPQQIADTQRPSTPVGWSDTDWLAHLERRQQEIEIPYVKGPLPERGWD